MFEIERKDMLWGVTCLSDLAALIMPVSVEGEEALCPDKIRHLLGFREGILNVDAIVLLDGVEELVGFRVQAASV